VFVNTGLVGKEVGVDSEGGFDWAVLEDFSFDLFLIGANRVDTGPIVLVLGEGNGISIDTFLRAAWCGLFALALDSKNTDDEQRRISQHLQVEQFRSR
jgi:hypothetical protein